MRGGYRGVAVHPIVAAAVNVADASRGDEPEEEKHGEVAETAVAVRVRTSRVEVARGARGDEERGERSAAEEERRDHRHAGEKEARDAGGVDGSGGEHAGLRDAHGTGAFLEKRRGKARR